MSSNVQRRTRLTVRRTSIVLFIISTHINIRRSSRAVTKVLEHAKGPIMLYIGGISDRGRGVSACRFCSLKVNSPVPMSTMGRLKFNSLLSGVSRKFPPHRRCSSPSVVHATVIKHPGMKGSALVGSLLNCRHSLITSRVKAAHSTISSM